MGFFNPYGSVIRFVEEQLLPAKPFIFAERVSFDLTETFTINTPPTPPTPVPAPSTIDIAESLSFTLAEVVTVPANPSAVSETMVLTLAEVVTVPANPSAVSETIPMDISESMVITT